MSDYAKSIIPDHCLAKIVKILKIEPIKDANKIELAFILGWKCVVVKDEFKKDDLVIYISIDSCMDPSIGAFSFLEGKRLKTKKIRNEISQGLVGPLLWLKHIDDNIELSKIEENQDVTKILKIRKYVDSNEIELYEKNEYPEYIKKTNEERIQNCPQILNDLKGQNVVFTRKEDGTSATFLFYNKKFGICSRNCLLKSRDMNNCYYYEVADKYNIENIMNKYDKNIAIQGEIIGPKINCNRLKLDELDFEIFNIFDIDNKCYMNWNDVKIFCDKNGLRTVPELYCGEFTENMASVEYLLDYANKVTYGKNVNGEGMVVKNFDCHNRISFKVISNKYLLKND